MLSPIKLCSLCLFGVTHAGRSRCLASPFSSACSSVLHCSALTFPFVTVPCGPAAAGRAALVHRRFALSRFAATKALLRREVTLMQRNAIVYAYRLCQVSAGGMQRLRAP